MDLLRTQPLFEVSGFSACAWGVGTNPGAQHSLDRIPS